MKKQDFINETSAQPTAQANLLTHASVNPDVFTRYGGVMESQLPQPAQGT